MSKAKSIWSRADTFLSLTRKILLNSFTVVILILLTISMFGILGSLFEAEEEIDVQDKILWFKPVGVVVDSSSTSSASLDSLLLGSTDIKQHELDDLIDALTKAATDESLEAVYINVSELGMYYASAFDLAKAVKNIKAVSYTHLRAHET